MKKLVFATNNAHKLDEVRKILGESFEILAMEQIGCHDDIAETALTFEGNALIKARYIKEKYGYDCFADDSGLEITALGGEPGVFSARYAGEAHNSEKNMEKVLTQLQGIDNRSARFRTVIALVADGEEHIFEGEIAGRIIDERRGKGGFGYDPIFVPEGSELTFAEMGDEMKNSISHRARAMKKLVEYLLSHR
ncbi:MAG: non-canonical purine NTP diphosphatase [Coprobacter sp.]|nr:non-canonical purine NTP diphosphatase [Coprobacter sp.]